MKKPCTAAGYKKLKIELDQLIQKERPKVIAEIAEARSHGDLKENAEYHAAKEKQGWIESRIAQLSQALSGLEIVDVSAIKSTKVQFGATVKYENIDSEETAEWQLVASEEANVQEKKMSIASPIGKNLLGKEVGDCAEINIPKGTINIRILRIKYV